MRYIYALLWACDNTPLRTTGLFEADYDYVETVLKPFYESKGVRVVCVAEVNEEVTQVL